MRGAGMIDRIVVSYPELCTGCRQCELTCSYVHEGVYSPGLSRIRLVRFEGEGLSVPVTCVYCRRPYCEEVCPTGALKFESISQATREKRRGRVKEFALVMDATLGREER